MRKSLDSCGRVRHRCASPITMAIIVASFALACTGVIEGEGGGVPGSGLPGTGPGGPGGPGGSDGNPGTGGPCDPTKTSFAPARIWQLTDAQYVNVIRDVFGIELEGDDAHIVTPVVPVTYTNYSEGLLVGTQVAPNYERAAKNVGERVALNAASLLGSGTPSAEQMENFISTKIARAWRRPLAADEVAALTKIYSDALPDADVGVQLVMQAALQAPSFLYRTELGQGASTATEPVQLTPFEVASALSFATYESVPDDALWEKASDGTLADPAVLALEVDRLLTLPHVRQNLTKKAAYWLGVERLPNADKSIELFPEFTASLKDSLYQSVRAFLEDVLWTGTMADLFSSNTVYTNQEISDVYGIPGATGSPLVQTASSERTAGILTQPGFLAAANKWQSVGDPIHRGLFVYHSFICASTIPEPPADAIDIGEDMSGTEREKVALRAMDSGCNACHRLFDPIGLAFERYDAIGRYSETQFTERDPETGTASWKTSSTPIDESAVLSEALGPEFSGPLTGVQELAEKLATANARVARCASKQLAEYTLGYNPETQNSCELEAVKTVFEDSGSFVEFYRALFTSPAFVTRDPAVQ